MNKILLILCLITSLSSLSAMESGSHDNQDETPQLAPDWIEEHELVLATQQFNAKSKKPKSPSEIVLYILEFVIAENNIGTMPNLRLTAKTISALAKSCKNHKSLVDSLFFRDQGTQKYFDKKKQLILSNPRVLTDLQAQLTNANINDINVVTQGANAKDIYGNDALTLAANANATQLCQALSDLGIGSSKKALEVKTGITQSLKDGFQGIFNQQHRTNTTTIYWLLKENASGPRN